MVQEHDELADKVDQPECVPCVNMANKLLGSECSEPVCVVKAFAAKKDAVMNSPDGPMQLMGIYACAQDKNCDLMPAKATAQELGIMSLLQVDAVLKSAEAETTVPKMIPAQLVKYSSLEQDRRRRRKDSASSPDATSSGSDKCTPTCSWKCATPVCDEVCTPKCQAPRCQTRCNGMITSGCKMECEEPSCAVVCPERACAAQTCNACTTNCSKPMCKLNCPDNQDCTEVCETPVCTWDCKAPEKCPKPECHMECEKPRACMDQGGDTLPAIQPGQSIIRSFETPLSPVQMDEGDGVSSPTLPVTVLKAVSVPASGGVKLIE